MAQLQRNLETENVQKTVDWSPPQHERRYDHETVQEIVNRASRLQSQHADTLSAQQIETIGAEVGVDPVFIRRALALMEEEQRGPVTITERLSHQNAPLTARGVLQPLTSRGKWIATVVPLSYGVLTYVGFSTNGGNHSEITNTLAFVLGPALAVALGAGLKNRRLGALSGGLVGASIMAAAIARFGGGPANQALPMIAMFVGAGTTIGVVSASIAKRWPHLKTSADAALLRVATVIDHPNPAENKRG